MDNTKKPNLPEDDSWFDELFPKPGTNAEIGPDEQAISDAGLTHPADLELEKIIKEAKAMDPPPVIHAPKAPQDGPFRDEEYRDTFGGGESLEAMFEDSTPREDPADVPEESHKKSSREKPVRKTRPKRKNGYGLFGIPHFLAAVIWMVIAVAIGVSLGRMLWVCAADVLAFGKEDKEYTITITESDTIDTIAQKLKNAGIINYVELFKLYADLTGAEEEITAGTFTLRGIYDYHALVNFMSPQSVAREEVEVMIPEGYSCAQIFQLLEEKKVCTVAQLEEYAATGELGEHWFMDGITRGDRYCLEGYLFPDTYRFYLNDNPGNVLEKMLDNFEYRFTDVMMEMIEPLNERMSRVLSSRGYSAEYIESHKFTIKEIVIIASMIEKETASDSESFDISSVIYNRLTNPGNYPFLNIDATIIYALGGNIDPETGKTKPLTSTDLQTDGPYNTYTRQGLIPGPISNPGRASLLAALDPNETNYYFYVYNPNTSRHLFATNSRDHEKNVAYVRSLG